MNSVWRRHPQAPHGGTPVVVYVGGYGRSGSSLLDAILGNAPGVFGAGALTTLFASFCSYPAQCSCGAALPDCAIWGRVTESLEDSFSAAELATANQVTRIVEGGRRATAQQRLQYDQLWLETFRILQSVTGSRVVVDSSKSARLAAMRPIRLSSAGLDLRFLHLVRAPQAVVWSRWRGSNAEIAAGIGARPRRSRNTIRTAISWIASNLLAESHRRNLSRSETLLCQYERLTAAPGTVIGEIEEGLNLSFGDLPSKLDSGEMMDSGHGIGGNRTRQSSRLIVQQDREWLEVYPLGLRALSVALYPLARRYGYPMYWRRCVG